MKSACRIAASIRLNFGLVVWKSSHWPTNRLIKTYQWPLFDFKRMRFFPTSAQRRVQIALGFNLQVGDAIKCLNRRFQAGPVPSLLFSDLQVVSWHFLLKKSSSKCLRCLVLAASVRDPQRLSCSRKFM